MVVLLEYRAGFDEEAALMSWVFGEGTGLAGHCGSCSAGYELEPEWPQMLSLDFSYFLTNHIPENLAAAPLCLLNGVRQI